MTWSYAADGSPRNTCRFLALDTDPDNQLFSDEEFDVVLSLEEGDVRYAAAAMLERIASNAAMILRITRVFDTSVDGVAPAKILQANAAMLREQSDRQQPAFDIAQQVFTPDGYAQRIWNQRLAGIP